MSSRSFIQDKIISAAKSAGRNDVPQLVAVSKMQPVESILLLYREGQRVFGENYVQELIEKKRELDHKNISDIDFHFIGHLQTNKVKSVLPCVSTVHSVDSVKLYQELGKRAKEIQKIIGVYFQVNLDLEESKGGFPPDELTALSEAVSATPFEWIRPLGLMTIPNPELDPVESFKRMRILSQKHRDVLGPQLSMGMSKDFEVAITYGSNSVRIGTALFGPRV